MRYEYNNGWNWKERCYGIIEDNTYYDSNGQKVRIIRLGDHKSWSIETNTFYKQFVYEDD